MTSLPSVLSNRNNEDCKIALLHLAYKSRYLIKQLKNRGKVIQKCKYDKLEKIDEKLKMKNLSDK